MKTLSILAALAAALPAAAGVTAVNGGAHEWSSAPWTAGPPGPEDAGFLNANTDLSIRSGTQAGAQGLRIGNTTDATSRLLLEGGALNVMFLVIGDAADSAAEFIQSDGILTVTNTRTLDLELGNPMNTPALRSTAAASFSGGSASLADIRFNLRPARELSLTFSGSRLQATASSLSSDTGSSQGWLPATLEFIFDQAGIAPLRLSGLLDLGGGDRIAIKVDGSRYKGSAKRFVLVDATSAQGEPVSVSISGFARGVSVKVEDGDLVLQVP